MSYPTVEDLVAEVNKLIGHHPLLLMGGPMHFENLKVKVTLFPHFLGEETYDLYISCHPRLGGRRRLRGVGVVLLPTRGRGEATTLNQYGQAVFEQLSEEVAYRVRLSTRTDRVLKIVAAPDVQ